MQRAYAAPNGRFRDLMSPRLRYVQIGVSLVSWSVVVLAATYRSHTPVVFGRYSWGYVTWLGLLVGVALTLSLVNSTRYQTLYRLRAGLRMSVVSVFLSLGLLELG